jgi:hypothetical protein
MIRMLLFLAALPAVLAGQPIGTKLQGELAGNVFFGNTRQLLTTSRLTYEKVDSAFQYRSEGRFNYGQTKNDSNVTEVSKRSWIATASGDLHPFADVVPFIQAALESSLEKKIDRRYSAGTGARYNFIRRPLIDVILSLGVLGERTRALDAPEGSDDIGVGRGLATLRIRREFSDRISFTSESGYQPALRAFDRYTFATDNSLRFKMSGRMSFAISLRDSYDSEATLRGARTNNDGEFVVGVLATR